MDQCHESTEMKPLDQTEEETLNLFTYEVSDEALEAAGMEGEKAQTHGFATVYHFLALADSAADTRD